MYLPFWSMGELLVLCTCVGVWTYLCSLASYLLHLVLQPEQVQSCCFIHQFVSVFYSYPLPRSIFPFPSAVPPWWELMGTQGWQKWCVMSVCEFTKSLCISDWSGSWSDLIRSRGKSPSSVLLNLAHPGEKFCSTSSTSKTTRQHTHTHTHTVICFSVALSHSLFSSVSEPKQKFCSWGRVTHV